MAKVFEIRGCITLTPNTTEDEFSASFTEFLSDNDWNFSGEMNYDSEESVIEIEGEISLYEEITHDEFGQIFVKYLEDNDWYFGGGTYEA